MTKERINRELIRRLEAERDAALEAQQKKRGNGPPALREIYDDKLTGFGVRIRGQKDGAITFLYRWTAPDGQQKKTIGRYPAMSVEDAREAIRAFITRTDHKADTMVARVAKHERRVADQKNVEMPTVGDYLDGDYATYWRGTTKSETPEANLKNIRRDFPDLMDRRLDEVTRPMMKKWIEKRIADGAKPSGINRVLGSIGGLFSHAVEHEIVTANPCARLRCKVDPEDDEHGRELTADEEQRLRAALDAREARIRATPDDGRRLESVSQHLPYVDHVKPAILFALNTGLRRSELLRACWTAIDWKAKTFTVEARTSKVKRSRVIPLNAEAFAILKTWRAMFKRHDLIFTNEFGAQLREVRDWNKIKREAQITDFRFMDTRHHAATRMINEGAYQYHVQKILGHADGRMTQRYMKARNEKLAEAVALLDQPRTIERADDNAEAA
jgi:integrase